MYRHIRNPMIIGVLMTLAGHFLWFGYWSQLAYAGFIFTAFHIFVLLYEERHLQNAFGKTHEEYAQRVPRWIPRIN
jgi:protein-S-isoprenylcysteine O-methyltransferase Ste14